MTKYDPANKILFGQWRDNKVVSFVSTLPLVGGESVTHWCGREVKTFKCPSPLCAYNQFMGYVDLVDYDKQIGGGFTSQPHFKIFGDIGFHAGELAGSMEYVMQKSWNYSKKLTIECGEFGWLTSCFNGKIHMIQVMIHPVAVRSLLNMKNGIWGMKGKVSAQDV